MRILMLGWEFPPFISGGLGTACFGLTKALSQQDVHITFVLPKAVPVHYPLHVRLVAPRAVDRSFASGNGANSFASHHQYPSNASDPAGAAHDDQSMPGAFDDESAIDLSAMTPADAAAMAKVRFRSVASGVSSSYGHAGPRPGTGQRASRPSSRDPNDPLAPISIINGSVVIHDSASPHHAPTSHTSHRQAEPMRSASGGGVGSGSSQSPSNHNQNHNPPPASLYDIDILQQSQRYANLCAAIAKGENFDVVHAHDWMTFPAGMAVAAVTGKPLVVHVHSTEFDRSGEHIDQRVYDIERRGMMAATRVIVVSHLTKSILQHRYGIDPAKIDVVYNGIENGKSIYGTQNRAGISKGDKIVLFLGRITMQKGPEYFIAAAKKVLEKFDKVKFVMAGSGDKVRDIIELAAAQGIGHKVLFTGFLRGADVERIFKMADVYVMPSVSEPFGIAPLEAISHNVPVIISKTSGVSEVLTHVLKVDFWDTHEIANKIIAVLRHPPLSSTLKEQADIEIKRLTWDDAANKCRSTYRRAMAVMEEVSV